MSTSLIWWRTERDTKRRLGDVSHAQQVRMKDVRSAKLALHHRGLHANDLALDVLRFMGISDLCAFELRHEVVHIRAVQLIVSSRLCRVGHLGGTNLVTAH